MTRLLALFLMLVASAPAVAQFGSTAQRFPVRREDLHDSPGPGAYNRGSAGASSLHASSPLYGWGTDRPDSAVGEAAYAEN